MMYLILAGVCDFVGFRQQFFCMSVTHLQFWFHLLKSVAFLCECYSPLNRFHLLKNVALLCECYSPLIFPSFVQCWALLKLSNQRALLESNLGVSLLNLKTFAALVLISGPKALINVVFATQCIIIIKKKSKSSDAFLIHLVKCQFS